MGCRGNKTIEWKGQLALQKSEEACEGCSVVLTGGENNGATQLSIKPVEQDHPECFTVTSAKSDRWRNIDGEAEHACEGAGCCLHLLKSAVVLSQNLHALLNLIFGFFHTSLLTRVCKCPRPPPAPHERDGGGGGRCRALLYSARLWL